ncbi:SecY-interacting protein [Pseudoalteromonas sp. McH1-7]|uniref:SecY-interacting protein n=1 Tax=Pseudoalteromonas sp. McH1-7 TaxID=2745574 RepID=UPI0015905EA7|nr:SecY-interacting protein [Pseudoalteromonas sp. McH1-7]NUZ11345.1 SecY-interacting protein [Pseudoalteromonas sp. McH1-7]
MTQPVNMACLHQAHADYYHRTFKALPSTEYDEAWPSPCEQGEPNKLNEINWQAVERNPKGTFDELAKALETQFPDGLNTLYGDFFSGNITAFIDGKKIELLQAWNADDFDRLQQNITGHILMKRRLKQPDTVFIGLTEADDLLVSVDVSTGQVGLEFVGKKQHHVLADSIAEFVDCLIANYLE